MLPMDEIESGLLVTHRNTGLRYSVVDVGDGTHALALTTELRRAGLAVDRAFDGRSMKAQMKLANRSNARHAVIVGPDEVATDTVQLKPLFGGDQRTVPRGEIAAQLRKSTSS